MRVHRRAHRAGRLPVAKAVAAALALSTLAAPAAAADPTKAQCVEANTKGQDLRRAGKLTLAREQLGVCSQGSCPALVRDDCSRRMDELDRAQPTIGFEVKDASGQDLTAVRLSVDGAVLAESLQGAALPVDPGPHDFTFEASGLAPVTKRFVLLEGEKFRRERVAFAAVAVAEAPKPAALPVTPSSSAEPERPAGNGLRTTAFIVGGAGVVGVAAGAILGILATSAKSSYTKDCGANIGAPDGLCNAAGVSGHDDASTKATLSTVFFALGGAAVATGVVLYIVARPSGPSAAVGLAPNGLLVGGRF
jgi:hypothetical protein